MRPVGAFVVMLALALLGGGACDRVDFARGPGRGDASRASGANVLLVTVDTLRADHVGVYGAPDAGTPTLDALAADGARFETAFAPAPLTLPSHASLLTGLTPVHHGVRHNGLYHLLDSVETLAEGLSNAGWFTGAVVGAAVLDSRYGLAQGFEAYDDAISGEASAVRGYGERPATEVTDRALAWLESAREPFFLWVHYYDPHALYRPPPPFDARFAARPYAGEIAYVDSEVGRLGRALDRTRRAARTLVVVTSDHGESLGEHGEATHGYTLYDAALRVPLIFHGPGVPPGRVVGGLASLVDVAPTIRSLVGIPNAQATDGIDLARLWKDEPAAKQSGRALYSESLAPRLDHGWAPLHALRTAGHLYVRAPRPELYALASDPAEQTNLLEPPTKGAASLAKGLERRLAALLQEQDTRAPLALDPAERNKLEALGYALPSAPVSYNGIDPKVGLRELARYAEASRAFARGEFTRARGLAEQALPAMPESARLHGLLAGIHVRLGDSRSALPHAEHAARLVPEAPEYRQLLGDVRYNVGDLDGAIDAYRAARERAPESTFIRERLSWLERQRSAPAAPRP